MYIIQISRSLYKASWFSKFIFDFNVLSLNTQMVRSLNVCNFKFSSHLFVFIWDHSVFETILSNSEGPVFSVVNEYVSFESKFSEFVPQNPQWGFIFFQMATCGYSQKFGMTIDWTYE